MRKILIFLLILFSSLFFLLFHDKGNVYLKPYLASYLEKKLKQKISVKVEHLKIDFNYIELRAKLNEVTDFNAHGELSFLTQNLNLAYTLRSDNLENKIDINGTVKGLFDNMQIEGKEKLLTHPYTMT